MSLTAVPNALVVPPSLQADIDDIDAYAANQPQRDFMTNAKGLLSGGGALLVDTGYNIKWTERFIMMGAGRSSATAKDGYFEVVMPPVGTVIPRVGITTQPASVTVTAAGINFDPWDALYYIVPLGSTNTSLPANFRIVQYTADFTVPFNWVPICIRNSDGVGLYGHADTVQWGNGISMTPWLQPTLALGWVHYSAPYGPGRYRKYNGMVVGSGLLSSGTVTANVAVFTLPVGFRPAIDEVLTASTSPLTGAPYYSEVRVRLDGSVCLQTGTTGYMSLANINFPAEA